MTTNTNEPAKSPRRAVMLAVLGSFAVHIVAACFCAFAPMPPTTEPLPTASHVEIDSVFAPAPVPPAAHVTAVVPDQPARAKTPSRPAGAVARTSEMLVPESNGITEDTQGSAEGDATDSDGNANDGVASPATAAAVSRHGADESPRQAFATRALLFSAFINHVKRLVTPKWQPRELAHRLDPYGHFGERDRDTLLAVVVDGEGRVVTISVERSCGIDYLDEEAMAAFRRAAPFHEPPVVLLGDDGKLHFTFGFHIDNTTRLTATK